MPRKTSGPSREVRSRRSPSASVQVVIAVLAVCSGLLVLAVNRGYIYGDLPVRYSLAAAVGLATAVAAALWLGPGGIRRGFRNPDDLEAKAHWPLVTLPLLVGFVSTLYGAFGLIAGGAVESAAAPTCPGIPPKGDGYELKTPDGGVTSREGPNILARQVGRLGGACAVLVDGYCYGTPVDDVSDPARNDSRWLRVFRFRGVEGFIAHHLSDGADEDEFIAAGTISAQVSDEVVKHLTGPGECGSQEAPAPGDAELKVLASSSDSEFFGVTANNTFDFGFALMMLQTPTTGDPLRPIPPIDDDADTRDTSPAAVLDAINDVVRVARWRPAATAQYLTEQTDIVVAGVGCLGIGAPATTALPDEAMTAYRVNPDGTYERLESVPDLSDGEEALLARAACRELSP